MPLVSRSHGRHPWCLNDIQSFLNPAQMHRAPTLIMHCWLQSLHHHHCNRHFSHWLMIMSLFLLMMMTMMAMIWNPVGHASARVIILRGNIPHMEFRQTQVHRLVIQTYTRKTLKLKKKYFLLIQVRLIHQCSKHKRSTSEYYLLNCIVQY